MQYDARSTLRKHRVVFADAFFVVVAHGHLRSGMGFVAATVNGKVLDVGESQNVVNARSNGGVDLANDRSLIRSLGRGCARSQCAQEQNGDDCAYRLQPPAIHGLVHALIQTNLFPRGSALHCRCARGGSLKVGGAGAHALCWVSGRGTALTHDSHPRQRPREVLLLRERYEVRGVVQGVGFRPFVYRLASEEELAGFIGNDTGGVTIEIEGPAERVEAFRRRLEAEAPPLARIDSVAVRETPATGEAGFRIIASDTGGHVSTGHSRRRGYLRGLPARIARPQRPPLSLSIFELHQLRPALHHHAPHSLRPPADLDGALHHVRGLPGGVRRSHQPALPCAAQRLPGVRTARLAGCGRRDRRFRPAIL